MRLHWIPALLVAAWPCAAAETVITEGDGRFSDEPSMARASDGSLYVACGETTAQVLRLQDGRWSDEGPGTPGRVVALAEDAGGTIYAAGSRSSAPRQSGPLLRKRTP